MKSNYNKTNVILTALFILSLLFGGWLLIKNKSAKIEAAKEKSVLLAEKEMLNKEAKDLAVEKKKATDLNYDQKKRIDELLKDVETKNNEIQRLIADNTKVKDLRKKLKELEQIRNNLKTEIESLKNNLDGAAQTNSKLESDMQALKVENDMLNTELILLKSLHSNDYLIRGIKRNQKKITAFARLTKVINLSFDFPETQINELGVSILTPDGKTYTAADKNFVSLTPSKEAADIYSSGLPAKRMDLRLKPEKKFAKGIYKFTILKDNETVATMQLQLK